MNRIFPTSSLSVTIKKPCRSRVYSNSKLMTRLEQQSTNISEKFGQFMGETRSVSTINHTMVIRQ